MAPESHNVKRKMLREVIIEKATINEAIIKEA